MAKAKEHPLKPFYSVLVLAFACASTTLAADNQLTDAEKKDGWILLFNGKDYTGWQCNNGKEVASDVVDGTMQPYKSGGYLIVYKEQFGDFILVAIFSGKFESPHQVEQLVTQFDIGFELFQRRLRLLKCVFIFFRNRFEDCVDQ